MQSTRPNLWGPSRRNVLCSVALVCALSVLLPAISRAQDDVAEAARQEKARKEALAKKSRHVYTNEDLQKKEILNEQDRAAVEARKKEVAPAPAVAPAPSVDSEEASKPTESLGEVARRYRAEREARQAEEALRKQTPSQFPMDIMQPALAHPIFPAEGPKRSPIVAPKFEMPRTGKIRDPFSRSEVPSRRTIVPAVPNVAIVPKAIAVVPVAPAVAKPARKPVAPKTHAIKNVPARIDATGSVTVKAGDSLWKISREHLGSGTRWQELVAANPNVSAPTRVRQGTVLVIPGAAAENVKQESSTSKMTIQKGDSLWKIALSQYGQGSSWTCLAQANPMLRDPNAIFPGQTLVLPASCTLRR
jgi:nucleoid-associated protein YgaU